jgi:L-alanine-DL-glutamate epimerase-like enolase superfamily enzyme
MKITNVETWMESLELTRPYTIATRSISAVDLFFVRLTDEGGAVGLGSASPAEDVTGESPAACEQALQPDRLPRFVGRDACHIGALCREVKESLGETPAAGAALDMAIHDLFARHLGVPLVELLGRRHEKLPTSITVGIKSAEEALAEVDEYLGRGFRHLKVKIGLSFEEDVERLRRLREKAGPSIRIRVDANKGYTVEETRAFESVLRELEIEFIEQPLPASSVEEMRGLPPGLRSRVAADESLIHERDALRLAGEPAACGIFNIKLMKCGGISPALRIASIAEAAGIDLMWGCMDESVVSISAALHAAYACGATRYLDLDGSFDLARDLAEGGFVIEEGCLRILDEPGLGVRIKR